MNLEHTSAPKECENLCGNRSEKLQTCETVLQGASNSQDLWGCKNTPALKKPAPPRSGIKIPNGAHFQEAYFQPFFLLFFLEAAGNSGRLKFHRAVHLWDMDFRLKIISFLQICQRRIENFTGPPNRWY